MQKFVQLLVAGIATGSLYGLMAMGLVFIYRATATLNFAHGMMGTIGAWAYASFIADYGINTALAVLMVVPVGIAVGLLTYLVIGRPLATAEPLQRTIATILWMVVIRAGFFIVYDVPERNIPAAFTHKRISLGGVGVSRQQVGVVTLTIVISIVLFVWLRYSRFGLASRAVALGRDAAQVSGLPLAQVDSASWAIGGVLACIGGVMILPFTLANVDSLNVFLSRIFAAALVGLMVSFPLALVGGIGIGLSELMLQGYYSSATELREMLPFIVVMVVLARLSLSRDPARRAGLK